jgi:hypothetical protein
MTVDYVGARRRPLTIDADIPPTTTLQLRFVIQDDNSQLTALPPVARGRISNTDEAYCQFCSDSLSFQKHSIRSGDSTWLAEPRIERYPYVVVVVWDSDALHS